MNAAIWLARHASERPDHPALVHDGRTLSYAQLADRVGRLSGCLMAAGLRPGDRVAAVQWNGPALLETLLACFHGGFCVVPVNARATPHEAAEVLGDAQVSAVVYDPEYGDHVAAIPCELRLALCTREDGARTPTLDDALGGSPLRRRSLHHSSTISHGCSTPREPPAVPRERCSPIATC